MLKDRAEKYTSPEAKEWYERAFGPKRNIMTFKTEFAPPEGKMKTSIDYFAEINYNMYPEMHQEFDPSAFPCNQTI